jgi:hypothetical protein
VSVPSTSSISPSSFSPKRVLKCLLFRRELKKTLLELAEKSVTEVHEAPKYPELDTTRVQRILDETLGYV